MQEIEYFFDEKRLMICDPELGISYDHACKTEKTEILYPSGQVKMETFYYQGLIYGPSTFFSEEGIELSKTWFIDGKREGRGLWHYRTGELYSLQRFRHGNWEGKQEYYFPDGTLKTVMHYAGGRLCNTALLYNQSGEVEREIRILG